MKCNECLVHFVLKGESLTGGCATASCYCSLCMYNPHHNLAAEVWKVADDTQL